MFHQLLTPVGGSLALLSLVAPAGGRGAPARLESRGRSARSASECLKGQWLVSGSLYIPAVRPMCARSARVSTQSIVLPSNVTVTS